MYRKMKPIANPFIKYGVFQFFFLLISNQRINHPNDESWGDQRFGVIAYECYFLSCGIMEKVYRFEKNNSQIDCIDRSVITFCRHIRISAKEESDFQFTDVEDMWF